MPSISPDTGLAYWFTNLRQFRTSCNNTTANNMDLLTFANSPISNILLTDKEKQTFVTSAAAATGYDDMDVSDLGTYKTFEALLDNWNPLFTAIAVLLQSLSTPDLQGASSADYLIALVSAAFPGGSAGAAWTVALNRLSSDIPAVCFTPGFQTKINGTVNKATSKMSDLIPQIAVLG